MDAVLFYVDDWLASGRIADMDAYEERGYFRLLMHAAKQPDCGLPTDEGVLALRSMLRGQWKKESRDEDFRLGKTSGQKILGCFFTVKDGKFVNADDGTPVGIDPKSEIDIAQLQEGRLYNERLLKVYFEFRRRQHKAVEAANKRWGKNACDMPEHPKNMLEHKKSMLGQCSDHATRVGNVFENSSSLTNTDTATDTQEGGAGGNQQRSPAPIPIRGGLAAEERFEDFYIPYCQATGKPVTEKDRLEALEYWREMPFSEKLEAVRHIPRYVEDYRPDNPRRYKTPVNYLKSRIWTEVSMKPPGTATARPPNEVVYPKTRPTAEQLRRMQEAS